MAEVRLGHHPTIAAESFGVSVANGMGYREGELGGRWELIGAMNAQLCHNQPLKELRHGTERKRRA